jgi:hypothetical protein
MKRAGEDGTLPGYGEKIEAEVREKPVKLLLRVQGRTDLGQHALT